MNLPTWYGLLLLALAAFRTWRLIARDTILDRPRKWLVGLPADWQEGDRVPRRYREHLATWIECPFCAGFWNAVVWWGAFEWSSHWALIVAAPWAISALLLVAVQVIEDDE